MLKVLLFALLIFLSCGSDKTPLVGIDIDPYSSLYGYWFGSLTHEMGGGIYYEKVLVFKSGGEAFRRVKRFERDGHEEIIYPWHTTTVGYSVPSGSNIYTYIPHSWECSWGVIKVYNNYNSLTLYEEPYDKYTTENPWNDIIFTKQDTLPDWAE